jgi:hypothetical protein
MENSSLGNVRCRLPAFPGRGVSLVGFRATLSPVAAAPALAPAAATVTADLSKQIAMDITKVVGNTPMVFLNRVTKVCGRYQRTR